MIVVTNAFYGHMTFQKNIHIACKVILSTSGELYYFFYNRVMQDGFFAVEPSPLYAIDHG